MMITVDTNVLVRLIMADDEAQSQLAISTMERAGLVAISVLSLCELAWVLARSYDLPRDEVARAIRSLADTTNVMVDRPAVDAGLDMLDAGGDFADGMIAYQGRWLGGETFVSFDKRAVKQLTARGRSARLLH